VDEPTTGGGLEWMAWTTGTLILVVCVLAALVGLAVLSAVRPSTPRKGFLPMPTARGDRIYVGLLGTGLILVVLLAASTAPVVLGLALGAVWMAVVLIWG
jgi:predicted small integral membrane protein